MARAEIIESNAKTKIFEQRRCDATDEQESGQCKHFVVGLPGSEGLSDWVTDRLS